jgi:hypothetical protein
MVLRGHATAPVVMDLRTQSAGLVALGGAYHASLAAGAHAVMTLSAQYAAPAQGVQRWSLSVGIQKKPARHGLKRLARHCVTAVLPMALVYGAADGHAMGAALVVGQ